MLRHHSFLCVCGLTAIAGLTPPALLADDVVYRTAVAAEVTEVPEGGKLNDFYAYSLNGNRVALTGYSYDVDTAVDGIWATVGNRLETVVSTQTSIPDSLFRFTGFGDFAQDGAATVFVGQYPDACTAAPCQGIYVHENGSYHIVVDTFQTVPGRDSNFESLAQPAIDGDQVAFVGSTDTEDSGFESGVYADMGDGLTTVADWDTPVPGSQGTFGIDEYDTGMSVEDGVVYFKAWDNATGERGYYAWDSVSQTIEVLRDRKTRVPGTTRRFDGAWSDSHCGGTYAFIGEYAGATRRGVFADFGDGLVQVVDESDLSAGAAEKASYYFDGLAACGDTIAFVVNDVDFLIPSVFLYRRSDDSLTLLLQRGDTVGRNTIEELFITPRALSEDAVAIGVRFVDNYRSGIVVASLHEPARRLLVGSDRDGNGHEEIVLLRQEGTSGEYVAKVHDAYTGGLLWTVPLGARPVKDFGLLDDPQRKLRVAVLFEALSGRTILDYVVASNGKRQQRIKLWQDAEPLALTLLPDLNGNGVSEVAVAGITGGGRAAIELREGLSGKRLAAYPAAEGFEPLRLLADVDVAGAPALVLIGRERARDLVVAFLMDALSGNILSRVSMGNAARWPVHDAVMIDDLDGDTVPELALARSIAGGGRSGWQAWSVVNGVKFGGRFIPMPITAMHLTAQPDVRGDGTSGLALLRVKPNGTSVVTIEDPVAAVSLGRYRMRAVTDGSAIAPLASLNENATAEFVVLGEHFETGMLEIHDSGDGTALRYFYLP